MIAIGLSRFRLLRLSVPFRSDVQAESAKVHPVFRASLARYASLAHGSSTCGHAVYA